MAEYEERSLEDLTEEPSPQRLEELRAKGMTAFSKELTGAMVLMGVLLLLFFAGSKFIEKYTVLMKDILGKEMILAHDITGWESLIGVAGGSFKLLLVVFVPLSLVTVSLAILASIAQVGVEVTPEVLVPDFSRLDPIKGFMRLLSMKNFGSGIRNALKVFLILGAVIMIVKSQVLFLPNTIGFTIPQIFHFVSTFSMKVFGSVWVIILALAGLDYWFQWRNFRKQARMTKQEAKQEQKEREGDPQIRARIRSIQREMARKRMMKSVPKADVIITNPTHIAVAIQYDTDAMAAPKVLAKGGDFLAERIKAVAREHGIPLVENKPLARALYKNVKVGQLIPRSLYQAVAEILAYVYRLNGKGRTKITPTATRPLVGKKNPPQNLGPRIE